jgi:hypothetical protein
MSTDDEERKEEEHKEVYAQFGAVAARASQFETLLVCMLLAIKKGKGELPTTEQYEELETRLQNSKTLGGLLSDVKTVVTMTPAAEVLLAESLRRRNYLMHHFFRERAFEFVTTEGRQQLVAELKETHAYFLIAVRSAEAILLEIARQSGITMEAIAEEAERMRQEARSKDRDGRHS